MSENVKVAVRVRPFNDREKKRKSTLVIGMNGQSTSIKDPANLKAEPKKFAFDYSYWSHDGFKERADGYLEQSNSKYADQNKVFDDLGRGVLDNAWKGYNTSLFAYGQTGSGKSYSMVGYGNNKGIVPLACNELFVKIEAKRAAAKEGDELKVSFSMLEIYNEQVRDLLNPKSLKIKGGLKVRQHPNQGFYVETLVHCPVNSYQQIEAKINEGTQNRTVASTNMNATSSRAHTIVAIKFSQKSSESGQSMTKTSLINLVDLAGSERADATGATGDRLKEGSAINQSLSTLGNVIKALADQSGGNKKTMVPYRDSVLTKLLKNALGGNSKTIMIAALSPADINYEETLSTLRFADRAKAIKTTAIINESPTDKLIRELREENQRLMDMLKGGGGGGAVAVKGGESDEELERIRAELEQNKTEMEEMRKNWEEEKEEQRKQMEAEIAAQMKETEQKKSMPHFWNLNEDPSLTGKVSHFINKGKTIVGSMKNSKADVQLTGLGIQNEHVCINNKNDEKITIKPTKGAKVVLDGNEITGEKELHHNDRVLFGTSNLFVFHHPKDFAKQQKNKKAEVVPEPTFETAQEEIAEHSGINKLAKGGNSLDDHILQDDLIKMWTMTKEANAMSEELDKKIKCEIALISPQARGKKEGRTHVCVKMKNMANKTEFMIPKDEFIDRKFRMQEMYQNYVEGDEWQVPQNEDPFYNDPTQPVQIGCVFVYVQALAYLIEMDDMLGITDYKGKEVGNLSYRIDPVDGKGQPLSDENYVEEPEELVGKSVHYKFNIKGLRGVPDGFAKTFCKVRFYLDENAAQSAEVGGKNPDYNLEFQQHFNPVTQKLVDYLMDEFMVIEVWGRQSDKPIDDNDLTTEELMKKDRTVISGGNVQNDHQYKMAAEANTYKKRMERAEAKLRKIRDLVEKANKEKKETIKVSEVENVLRSGGRLKAVATVVLNMKKAKLNQAASQACTLQ